MLGGNKVQRSCREKARLVDGLDEGAARAAAGIAARRDGALLDAVLGRGAGTTLPGERAEGAQSAWRFNIIYLLFIQSMCSCECFPLLFFATPPGRERSEGSSRGRCSNQSSCRGRPSPWQRPRRIESPAGMQHVHVSEGLEWWLREQSSSHSYRSIRGAHAVKLHAAADAAVLDVAAAAETRRPGVGHE